MEQINSSLKELNDFNLKVNSDLIRHIKASGTTNESPAAAAPIGGLGPLHQHMIEQQHQLVLRFVNDPIGQTNGLDQAFAAATTLAAAEMKIGGSWFMPPDFDGLENATAKQADLALLNHCMA